MRQLLLILILFSWMTSAFGQKGNVLTTDLIVLKDNSRLYGKIVDADNKTYTISIGGEPVRLSNKIVEYIYHVGDEFFEGDYEEDVAQDTLLINQGTLFELVPIVNYEKRGWYNIGYGSINFPGAFNEGGVGVENVTGYQFNRYTGLGLGLGFQRLDYRTGKIFPVYVQYRGYLFNKKVSPYYNLDIGFSLPLKDRRSNFTSSSPGTYFYPSVGYKCGSDKSAFMIDIGWRVANVTYINNNEFFSSEEKYFFNNVVLRLGVML